MSLGRIGASTLAMALALLVGGCQVNGQPIFNEAFLESVNGSEQPTELTQSVRQALKRNGQTAILSIRVTLLSEDSVKLAGYVPDDATYYEAERVAGNVDGVRYVANGLIVR